MNEELDGIKTTIKQNMKVVHHGSNGKELSLYHKKRKVNELSLLMIIFSIN